MESPIKKLDFTGKENAPFDADVAAIAQEIEAQQPVVKASKTIESLHAVAATIKPEEADEPLLRENPQRFVLFPIKYHEVSDAS